jgi:membrane protein required for colicin V production
MNGLDIAILAVFFTSVLIGAMRGFTKELLSLFSWGGATALSYVFLPMARTLVTPYIGNPMMADGVTLFCLFIFSLILLSIIANIIAGYIHETSFRGVDRSLGFGFGIFRGVVVISGLELLLSTFWPRHTQSPTIQSARFVPMARKGGDTILQILPSAAREFILEQAMKVETQLQAKIKENIKNEAAGYVEGLKQGDSSSEAFPSSPEGQPQAPVSPPNLPLTVHGHPQGHPPSYPSGHSSGHPGNQTQEQSQMVVIRPSQPGQSSQLTAPDGVPVLASPGNQGAGAYSPPPGQNVRGIGQAAISRDTQTTVDELARLKPRSTEKEERGYTRGQRDDMNRLFQAADGE